MSVTVPPWSSEQAEALHRRVSEALLELRLPPIVRFVRAFRLLDDALSGVMLSRDDRREVHEVCYGHLLHLEREQLLDHPPEHLGVCIGRLTAQIKEILDRPENRRGATPAALQELTGKLARAVAVTIFVCAPRKVPQLVLGGDRSLFAPVLSELRRVTPIS